MYFTCTLQFTSLSQNEMLSLTLKGGTSTDLVPKLNEGFFVRSREVLATLIRAGVLPTALTPETFMGVGAGTGNWGNWGFRLYRDDDDASGGRMREGKGCRVAAPGPVVPDVDVNGAA